MLSDSALKKNLLTNIVKKYMELTLGCKPLNEDTLICLSQNLQGKIVFFYKVIAK